MYRLIFEEDITMKTYIISVKQETILEIDAETEEAALEKAYETYLAASPETVQAHIVFEK